MNKKHLTIDSIVLLIAKTTMAFCVYSVFLFTAPLYNAIQDVGGISEIFKPKEYVVIGETALVIEIVDSSTERAKGLSGRENIDSNWGMLFVFDEPGFHSIWMKDMNFPIDIIWLNDVKQVVSVEQNVLPDSYPESFEPSKEALYVLEVENGFVKKNGIKIGDQLTIF